MIVSYNGSSFHGFQFQRKEVATIQGCLQETLSQIADHPVSLRCAGRTDAGVHATHQVVHFDTSVRRPVKAWVRGSNRYLPDAITVNWAGQVSPDFDARYSARARRYLYLIDNSPERSSFLVGGITHERYPLDELAMDRAGAALVGEHDFSSFRASGCQSKSPYREIHALRVYRQGSVVVIDVTANAFLHHMVRNIAGVLIKIGTGRAPVDWAGNVLAQRDRGSAWVTAAPDGLYLVDVIYPDQFRLPTGPDLPHLFDYLATGGT
ncbi:MAG: tRNA pseudouridine(38-40) synthase TruA [Pseudomonadales bacterium]